jgi:hypothetical protein
MSGEASVFSSYLPSDFSFSPSHTQRYVPHNYVLNSNKGLKDWALVSKFYTDSALTDYATGGATIIPNMPHMTRTLRDRQSAVQYYLYM